MKKPPTLADAAVESAEWFRSLADSTSTAIFVYRDKFLYVNRACERLCGYSANELAHLSFWELVHPDYQEFVRNRDAARLRGEDVPTRYELKILTKGGDERWLDFTSGALEIDGQPAAVGSAFDITERKEVELALVDSEERLNLAQRAARSLSWEWVVDTDALEFSDYANELLGFPVRDMVKTGEEFQRFIHQEDRPRLQRAVRRTVQGGGDLSCEIRCVSPQGDVRWLAEKALAIRDESGWTSKIIGVAHDITERKIAEEALFQEKERALVTLASIADGVIRTDAQGAIDYLNPVAQRLTGWRLAESYGRPLSGIYQVVDEASGKQALNPVDLCLQEQRSVVYPGPRRLVHRDGRQFAIHDSAAPIRNRQGVLTGAVLVFKDLSELREVEHEMERLARHDPITGLINRREFEAHLEETLQTARLEGRPSALCYLDLDQFKLINDTCGHVAGDQLVQQVASMLIGNADEQDTIARLGGDEFGILLPGREIADAQDHVEELLAELRDYRFSWEDRLFGVGVSGGLVPITEDSPEAAELLSAADAACYVAKEGGGNRIHIYQPGDQAVAERYGEMQWISRIHKAFDEDRFQLYQQRIEALEADGDEPPMCELLIRLEDESGHMIDPDAFIPAAERYGLISAIDRWVVRQALRRLAALGGDDSEDELRFTINISGQSLGEKGFQEFVVRQFESTGVDPQLVYFEITETSAIADLPHAMQFIAALKSMGCRFVLDDFGKGLSSFSYLKNLPVHYLKIDGDFVRNLTSDPIQAALVDSIHQIGRVMGLQTIAECVENEETLEALRRIGVDYVQGFYFSYPEPLASGPEAGTDH